MRPRHTRTRTVSDGQTARTAFEMMKNPRGKDTTYCRWRGWRMLRGVDGSVALGAASRLLARNLEEAECAENPSL